MIRLLVGLFLGGTVWCADAADKTAPTSLCDLLIHRDELNGKMVTVRGIVAGGGHGTWLRASQDCTYALITRSVTWPNVVALAYPDNNSSIPTDHAPFAVDWRAIRRADAEALRAGYDPGTNYMIATYVGLFVTYHDLDNRVTPGVPGAIRLGFGANLLGAPAQLLIRTIKDLVVVRDVDDGRGRRGGGGNGLG